MAPKSKPPSKKKPPAPKDRGARPLTSKERAFVTYMVAGMSQTEAYVKAGYSPRGAGPGASRLAKQLHILDAITGMKRTAERLRTEAHARQGAKVSEMLASATEAADKTRRTVDPAELELRRSIDAEVAAILSYEYGDAALIENIEISMGRKPARESIVIRSKGKKGEDGKPLPPIVIEVETYKRDASAANRALALLFERANVKAGREPGDTEGGQPLSPAAQAAFSGFRKAAGFNDD